MVLDINLFREDKGHNPEFIRESQRKRHQPVEWVDQVIQFDHLWRTSTYQCDQWRKLKGRCSKIIGAKKKSGETDGTTDELPVDLIISLETITDELLISLTIKQIVRISLILDEKIDEFEKKSNEAKVQRDQTLPLIGNLVHSSVPISDDEEFNVIERIFGDVSTEKTYSHYSLIHMIDGVDTERGASVAGSRGYFLKGPAVFLEQALIQLALNLLQEKDFEILSTPFFMRKEPMQKVAQLSQFDEELYKVLCKNSDPNQPKIEEKYLIATSEQPLAAFHQDEWISVDRLPIRYGGFSTCFRQEAGSNGRDTKGIFRVHQFEKIEQFCITSPKDDQSWRMFDEMIHNAEEFNKVLGIPYRIVNIVSGSLNNAAAKKFDLEAWFPGSGKFRELVSCSNCLDYQSRRLQIRFGQVKRENESMDYVHMLNATLCATTRTICAILENYQTENGIVVPDALKRWMPTKYREMIPFVKEPPLDLNTDTELRQPPIDF